MDSNKIFADFQFLNSKVSKFSIDFKSSENKDNNATINCDIDYKVINNSEDNGKYFGVLEFIVDIKVKVKNSLLFKVYLIMEGTFLGNPKKIDIDQFKNMLELNGVVTLSQLSRSYITSVTALSGINPPLNLPMINVIALKELKHKAENISNKSTQT